MVFTYTLLAACLLGTAWAQQYTTPVPILKQINRHNEDGSYSYGYEAADGSFKIETKYQTGEVYGKYGYVDDLGKVREVEYGASRRGFEPAGNDINVAPPTLSNNPQALPPLPEGQEDDGQYREDPSIYYKDERYNRPAQNQPVYRPQEQHQQAYQQTAYQQPAYQQPAYQQPAYQPQYQQQTYQQPTYYQPQTYQPQPSYQQPTYQQPAYQPYRQTFNPQSYLNSAQLATHPAVKNIDIFSGSYTVDYKKK